MNCRFLSAGAARRVGVVLALAVSLAAGARPEELGFGSHYARALGGEALGAGAGIGFGILASICGNEESMGYALVVGGFGGGLVGAAYGANAATEWHERNGSFGFDLAGALGAGVATILVGYGASENSSDPEVGEQTAGWSGLAVLGAVPLGAVLVQRLVAGKPPSFAAWHPRGASPGTIGLVARWTLR